MTKDEAIHTFMSKADHDANANRGVLAADMHYDYVDADVNEHEHQQHLIDAGLIVRRGNQLFYTEQAIDFYLQNRGTR